ncbi:N-acetyltransferase [Brevundimonas sp.]|uniref:N-acetyltransferase n=1 Tax=Brevundimonas sp. TaxID=1871086 RepID=UPI00289A550B|nr:N-acetyltransferase [Brevundimonas sp.]
MTLRHFHLSDAPGVNRLHRAVWWPERSPEGWRWLDENPARQALDAPSGWVIEDSDGAPAAFLGNFVQRFWRGDRLLYGATGFSIIVPPDRKGRSRDLIQAFMAQPGCFARYTLNANARSSPLYQRFGMTAWPPRTHGLKLSWIINPAACLYSRGLRSLVARAPRAALWLGEQLTPLHGAPSPAPMTLAGGVSLLDDLSDASPYSRFWTELRDQGRILADRSPAMLRWRYADPDLTTPPLHLVRRVGDRITGHAMAMLGKGNPIEPPVLEIIDLQALDHDRAAVRALVAALLRLAPGWGAAKVRLQVVSDSLLRDMGDLARKARREGGWGHCHAAFAPDIQTTEVDGPSDWRPTPFDGDYAFCVRPVPKRPPIPSGPWASSQDAPIATPA